MCEFVVPCSDVGKKKILVADDNSKVRKLLMLLLERSGYDTVEAATVHETLEQARATTPNLIIMDLAMPDGSGDEAILSLKTDPLTRDITIIVLTAILRGASVDRALAAGAAEILHKPVNLQRLELVLERHLSKQSQTPRLS